MKLQKHERQAVRLIRAVAKRHGITARVIQRGRHPCKVELVGPGGREVVGMPSSPADEDWAVKVAVWQAEDACSAIIK